MKFFVFLVFTIFAFLMSGCVQHQVDFDAANDIPLNPIGDQPVKISLCELQNDPATYNHKLVEVTGFFSHGFENASIFDPSCSSEQCIWYEYGGTAASGTMYCCGVSAERKRPETLTVENIPIPFFEDENFQVFDKFLKRQPDAVVHATILGRFFSGKKREYSNDNTYSGFGHFGMCSLLAVQKVIQVDSQDNSDLDYRASDYFQPELEKAESFDYLDRDKSTKDLIELQQKAESGDRGWSFNDPQKVAIEALAKFSKTKAESIAGLEQIRQTQGSFDYKWKNKREKVEYLIVVNRPYWLSFYAKDPKKVIWTVFAVYKIP